MRDIITYKLFLLSVQMGSITRAAEIMFIDRTAAGRRLKQLETTFGKKLLDITNRGCELTKIGTIACEDIKNIVEQYELMKVKINSFGVTGKKSLKIASTHSLISNYISYILPDFLNQYDDINIELLAIDHYHEINSSTFDVGLFPRTAFKIPLIQEVLFSAKLQLYASKEYIQRHGTIKNLEDLINHKIIIFGEEAKYDLGLSSWPLCAHGDLGNLMPYISVNSVDSMIRLSEAGQGIIGISDKIIKILDSNLQNICPHIYEKNSIICITYPESSKKLDLFNVFKNYIYKAEHKISKM